MATPSTQPRSVLDEVREVTSILASVEPRYRTKLTGAIAIEVIRAHLLQFGLSVSPRDVFIKGDPTEFDILIIRPNAVAMCGIVYGPNDVAAVIEVKYSGVYSQDVAKNLRKLFTRIRSANRHIDCVYLTLCENPKFKYKMTSEALGHPVFTLNWWADSKKIGANPGDDWKQVAACFENAVSRLPPPRS